MGEMMSRFFTDAISPYSRFIFRTMHAVIPKLSKTALTILKPVCISTMYRLIGSLCSFDAFHLSTAFLSVHSKDIILGVEGTSAKMENKVDLHQLFRTFDNELHGRDLDIDIRDGHAVDDPRHAATSFRHDKFVIFYSEYA